jgi:endoglucanase
MRALLATVLLSQLPAADGLGVPLRRGWNLGNTLDDWPLPYNQPVNADWVFEAVAAKGFDWVRIPAQWGPHTATTAPYAVEPDFMAHLNETVGWALAHNLTVMVNTHHENNWIDNSTLFAAALPRLVAIWTQIAAHFGSYPDERLVFELFNEPKHMSMAELNAMNSALLSVVRRTNPTRQIHFGGLASMNSGWLLSHPDAMVFPDGDEHLALTVHSYDPWAFAGNGPPPTHAPVQHTFNTSSAYATMRRLKVWSEAHQIPVYHDEFGCVVMQSNRTARLEYYAAYSKAASENGIGWAIWDDDGWWKTLDRRGNRTWDEGVLNALGMVGSEDTQLLVL